MKPGPVLWVDSSHGDDDGDGCVEHPFRTFVRAMQALRLDPGTEEQPRRLVLRAGGYTLDDDGLALLRRGIVCAAGDGLVFVNGSRVQVRRKRQPALRGRP